MPTTTIRLSTQTRDTLHQLAESSGITMQKVLEDALELYRRRHLLEQTNAAYAVLRDDPAVWQEIERERRIWDATHEIEDIMAEARRIQEKIGNIPLNEEILNEAKNLGRP